MSVGQQSRYIGRVGALAVALGVGGLIVALPTVAAADTGAGDSGKTTSSAGKHAPRNSAKPAPDAQKSPTPKLTAATATGALSAASRKPLDRLGGSDPLAPATEPLSFAVLAVTRRDGIARSARSVTTGGTVSAAAASVPGGSAATAAPSSAGATASSDLATVVRNVIDQVPGWGSIADQLAPIVADGLQDLLSNGAIGAEVNRLATNATILQFFSTNVATSLTSYLGVPSAVGTVIGDAAANFVKNTLGNTGVQTALDAIAGVVRPTTDQYTAIVAGLAANNTQPLVDYLQTAVPNSAGELGGFLSDPGVRAALASATSQAIVDLTTGPAVPGWLGGVVTGWVSDELGDSATATVVANALGNAVQGLLSNTKAMQGVGTVAGVAVSNFLGAPGVATALAGAANQFGSAVGVGVDWTTALAAAWQGLQADPAFTSALVSVADTAVSSLTTNTDVVAALAVTAKNLVVELAADPGFQTAVGQLFGPTYGPTLVTALADPTSAAQLGATASAVLTSFLGQNGVAPALSTAADQIATALLAGATLSDALQGALQSLASDPAVVAAFNATVPTALQSVLKAPAVRDVISTAAQDVVAKLIDSTPLKNTALAPVVSHVTKVAVDRLVSDPAAQRLIGSVAGDLLDGASATEVAYKVVGAVIYQPELQIAVGMAVGQGIGAMFGDNAVTYAVGQVIGAAAALTIGMASATVQLLDKVGVISIPKASSYYEALQLSQSAPA